MSNSTEAAAKHILCVLGIAEITKQAVSPIFENGKLIKKGSCSEWAFAADYLPLEAVGHVPSEITYVTGTGKAEVEVIKALDDEYDDAAVAGTYDSPPAADTYIPFGIVNHMPAAGQYLPPAVAGPLSPGSSLFINKNRGNNFPSPHNQGLLTGRRLGHLEPKHHEIKLSYERWYAERRKSGSMAQKPGWHCARS
jgi:hypothetical protein